MSNYFEAASGFAQAIVAIANSFTLGKFIRWLFVLIVIGAIVFYTYDRYSSTSYYNKLERKLRVIEKVEILSNGDTLIGQVAKQKLLTVLHDIDPPSESIISIPDNIVIELIKLLGAVIFPVFIILTNLSSPDRKNIFYGASVFIVVFGIISLSIPVIFSLWLNFFIFPVVEFLLLIPFMPKKDTPRMM